MANNMNISTGLAPRWKFLADEIRSHAIWMLAPELQPVIHVRAKTGTGISFSCWQHIPQHGINQYRNAAVAAMWQDVRDMADQVRAILDHAYEMGLFAQAVTDEIAECDPEGVLNEQEESHQPWSILMPLPMRRMIETGMAELAHGKFVEKPHANHSASYDVTYQELYTSFTHQVVETYEYNTPHFRYFYGKSLHYLRIFNCILPLTAKTSLKHQLLSKVVDLEVFHHPDLRIAGIEQNKNDLVLNLPHILYPSARPPS